MDEHPMIDPAALIETVINHRYRSRNLAKSPWKSLPDESWDKWTEAMRVALEAHGLLPAKETKQEPLEGQLVLFEE